MAIFYEKGGCGSNLKHMDKLIVNMIDIMVMYASQDFWKVLAKPTNDPFTGTPDLTEEEKATLVANGLIKRKPYNNDVSEVAHNEIRVYIKRWDGIDTDTFEIIVGFDVICHNSNIELKDGRTASMLLMSELLDLFNGAKVDKNVGNFIVDQEDGFVTYYNSEYQGYHFTIKGWSS